MATDSLYREKAPGIMALLMADFGLDAEGAAAILGNLGHESGGFKFLQEKQPLVPGSEGGYGWAQWTGPRRRAYEAYVERNGLDPASDKANYGWLWVELKGDEAKAVPAVKAAGTLYEKVVAFELAFERAGVKAYDSRLSWANKALAAFHAAGDPAPVAYAPSSVEVLHPLPAATQLAPIQSGLNLQQLLPMIMAVLSMVQKHRQTTGQPTDIMQILMDIGQQMVAPPVSSPAPVPVAVVKPKESNPLSMLFSVLLGSVTAGTMASGHLGTPFGMGPDPTLNGSLAAIASIASPFIAMIPGGYGVFINAGLNFLTGIRKVLPEPKATPK